MDSAQPILPSSSPVFGNDSTNIHSANISSPRPNAHKGHHVNTIAPTLSTGAASPSASTEDVLDYLAIELSLNGGSLNEGPDEHVQSYEKCMPARMKRKRLDCFAFTATTSAPPASQVIHDVDAHIGNIDVVNASSEAENNVPSTRPTKVIVRKESVQGTHVQSQPATRSSARIRTERDLRNAPDAVPQQKKRKRGESRELAATATVTKASSLLPTDNVDKKPKTATPLTIRIPVMKFSLIVKVDNAKEREKYPGRTFPDRAIPVDGDIEKLKKLRFPRLPVRMRRMLVIYAALANRSFTLPSRVRNPTTPRKPTRSSSRLKPKAGIHRTAIRTSKVKGKG